jgi:hypothetical protein
MSEQLSPQHEKPRGFTVSYKGNFGTSLKEMPVVCVPHHITLGTWGRMPQQGSRLPLPLIQNDS